MSGPKTTEPGSGVLSDCVSRNSRIVTGMTRKRHKVRAQTQRGATQTVRWWKGSADHCPSRAGLSGPPRSRHTAPPPAALPTGRCAPPSRLGQQTVHRVRESRGLVLDEAVAPGNGLDPLGPSVVKRHDEPPWFATFNLTRLALTLGNRTRFTISGTRCYYLGMRRPRRDADQVFQY